MLGNGAEGLYYCDDRALQIRCPKTSIIGRFTLLSDTALQFYTKRVTILQPLLSVRVTHILSKCHNLLLSRLSVVSRKAKKKQHECTSSGPHDHYSEIFTQMAALKLENSGHYSSSAYLITDLPHSNWVESTSQRWSKSA